MGAYPSVGNIARLFCAFTNNQGSPADPTTVTVQVKPPQAPVATFTPVRDGVGAYHYDVTLNAAGTYQYRFIGTGAIVAQTGDQSFTVPQPSF